MTSLADCDNYQFGFKAGHSTTLCAGVFRHTVDYFVTRGSHVFVSFVDFSKAFDYVSYWKLFNQLLDDGVDCILVELLAYWYCNQEASIIWINSRSGTFYIANGTKQGGVLSPYLFTRYIRPVLLAASNSRVGCTVADTVINVLAYADDIVLAPSWRALQHLISVLEACRIQLDLTCNTKKTVRMVFAPCNKSRIVSDIFPNFVLCGQPLQFVSEFRYLGHIISNQHKDDTDIAREIHCMYTRINMLIRKFHKCSTELKIRLFRAYCICLYGAALWTHFAAKSLNKFRRCYHKCICFLGTANITVSLLFCSI